MKVSIRDILRALINPDSPSKPAEPPVMIRPARVEEQWRPELERPCYCGKASIWLDFHLSYVGDARVTTAVGTCDLHRGVDRWQHEDDGPVRAYWDLCPTCPPAPFTCRGHIVIDDKLYTVIR